MAADHDIIRSVLRDRAELAILAEGVSIASGSTFESPFRVPSGTLVDVSPGVLRSGAALPVHLRHALEIAMWHRIAPTPRTIATEVAVAGLACWTALQYVSTLAVTQAAAALDALPAWMRHLHRFAFEREAEDDAAAIAAELVTVGGCLLHLQRPTMAGARVDREAAADAGELVAELLDAARPLERLFTRGGDSRICCDPVSRTNKYGSSAVPTATAVAFSSCTASSPSVSGYRAAEEERQKLLRVAVAGVPLRAAYGAAIDEVRHALAAATGLDVAGGADIVLATSGTDCELYALQLALSGHDRPLLSIVVGPDEVGSGSLLAAGGSHFDRQLPLGGTTTPGQPVQGLPVHRVRVTAVGIRDERGRPVAAEQMDAQVASLARTAAAGGARVLLHLVDGSKTGLRAPSIDAVRGLHAELGDALVVLVDAAQMRTRPEMLREYVRLGWLVMVSGSKFFMGPAFSGALLVPREIARRTGMDAAVAGGLADYLSAFEVPRSWSGWRAALRFTPNLGLLVRWRAALAEIELFQSAGHETQQRRFAGVGERIRTELQRRDWVRPIADRVEEGKDDLCASIWTFAIAREPGSADTGVLGYDEAWQAYVMLNRDLSAALPPHATAAERQVAAIPCHIGQPVRLRWRDGSEAGALRLALGARSIQAREADVAVVCDKLEVIRRYWRQLTAQQAVA
jgi:hypothetical protein